MAAAPPVLGQLLDRFDPSAWDVPGKRARLRLEVDGDSGWDFVVRDGQARLDSADRSLRPNARLCADAATWSRIARDLRGGMNAFRHGKLEIRDDLHLGVGFLAATAGTAD